MTVRNSIGVVDKQNSSPVPIVSTADARNSLAALVRRGAGARPKQGIMRSNATGDLVVSGTSGWEYAVQAGHLIIAPDAASGVYPVPNDGVVNVPTIAKPGTGSRIDLIVMGQTDAWDRSGATTAPVLTCINGQASTGTPTAPAVPDGCIEVARNVMTSAATTTASAGNTITQTAPFTTSPGGMQFYRNAAEETADLPSRQAGDPAYLGSTQKATVGTGSGTAMLLARALGNGPNGGSVVYTFPTTTAMQAAAVGQQEGDYADVLSIDSLYRWSGTSWVQQTPGVVATSADLASMPSEQGSRFYDTSTGVYWRYYAAWNSLTNPAGMAVAGWYPEGPLAMGFNRAQNIANGTGVSMSSAPILDAAVSTVRAADLVTPSGSGYTLRNGGLYQFGTAVQFRIGATVVTGGGRIFEDVTTTRKGGGSQNMRMSWFGNGTEDNVSGTLPPIALERGSILNSTVYHTNGTTVTWVARDFITYLGPVV